jgi:DNA (cytosine-5)-methyltransferase 1
MKYLSLFSGIGGFEIGIKNAAPDWSCVGYSEINKPAIKVYEQHFPGHVNFGDITKFNTSSLPDFDVLVGGFPCQAFSIAGNRKGFADVKRGGNLVFEIFKILEVKRGLSLDQLKLIG